jgi:hypothetical protein
MQYTTKINLIRVKDVQASAELLEMSFSILKMEATEFDQNEAALIKC